MVVTMGPEDAALQIILVMKEKVIVMDLVMVVNMMAMLDVKELSCVEVIIVRSLELITMRKMTVVSSRQNQPRSQSPSSFLLVRKQN